MRARTLALVAALQACAAWSVTDSSRHNLTIYMVKGMLVPIDVQDTRFSVEVGEELVNEYKLELHCTDEQVEPLVAAIRDAARTGHSPSGWVYVADIAQALPLA